MAVEAGGLGREGQKVLRELADKYNDLQSLDRLSRVQGLISGVKETVHEGLELALANESRMHEIEGSTEDLAESATRFRRGAADIERLMWWRMVKTRLLIAFIVLVIIAYIVIPIIIDANKEK